jgi:hypothetical protein
MRLIGLAVVLAVGLTLAPLGADEPSGSVDSLTGLYEGYVFNPPGNPFTHISATLVQVGDQIAGVWTTGVGSSGTITGIVVDRWRLNWEGLQTVPCLGSLKGFAAIKDRGSILEGRHSLENCNGKFEVSSRVHRELLVRDFRPTNPWLHVPLRADVRDSVRVSRRRGRRVLHALV